MTKEVENHRKIEELEIADDWNVSISSDAFRKMIFHILRFANEILEEKQEVLGVCIGEANNNDKSINVINVIPIIHGDAVELGFSQELHDTIKEINDKITETNLRLVGWYHSHIGYGIFFSNADRNNQLYFQNKENLYGFGIVFDYKLMNLENDFGFEIFRFKDYSKGAESDYIKVPHELEKPNHLEYFRWIKDLMEDSQRKSPRFISEYKEIRKPLPEELQEIPLLEKESIEPIGEIYEAQLAPIFSGLQEGSSKFIEIFTETYKNQLREWMKNVSNGSLKGTEYIRSSINKMKDAVFSGVDNVEKYFDKNFTVQSELFTNNVSESITRRINNQNKIKEEIKEFSENNSNNLRMLIEKNFNEFTEKLKENISHTEVKLHNIKQNSIKIEPLLKEISEIMTNTLNNTNLLSEEVIKDIELLSKRFETSLKTEIDNIYLDSKPIKEKYKEIDNLIERLQKIIADFRQLK